MRRFFVLLFIFEINFVFAAELSTDKGPSPQVNQTPSKGCRSALNRPVRRKQNQEIKKMLFEITRHGHVPVGYKTARQLVLGDLFLEENDGEFIVRDIYCLKKFRSSDFEGGDPIGPQLIPDTRVLNVEHAWPQSRFNAEYMKDLQRSDLHHLFPADAKMNAARSSIQFGEVNGKTVPRGKCRQSKIGKTPEGYRFEPPNEVKGELARAMFYFAIRYQRPLEQNEETLLRRWHKDYPVTEGERLRHNLASSYQGNRNPFIDHPEWVDQVLWFN